MARVARTREGHPHHTALLGEWAIGKTTLLMHWRRLLRDIGDIAVLSLAYPHPMPGFLSGLRHAVEGEAGAPSHETELAVGVDLGITSATVRRRRSASDELRESLARVAKRQRDAQQLVTVLVDDINLLEDERQALLQLRAVTLELYASDLPIALVVASTPSLFSGIGIAHESLVRFFEPLALGRLDAESSRLAICAPLEGAGVAFTPAVVDDIAAASAGRPYYLQKLAYYAFDAAVHGRVGVDEYRPAFERAFASVSQEIFANRWTRMSPAERAVVRIVAQESEPSRSGAIEAAALKEGVTPPATRQALRRLAARGQLARLANGRRGHYLVDDPLFRRFLVLQSP